MPSTPPTTPSVRRAAEPAELHAIIQDAVNTGDVEAFLAAHDDDAAVVLPPDGIVATGHDELRAALASLLVMRPVLTLTPIRTLQTDDHALVHGRWRLTIVDHDSHVDLAGRGAMVSRRDADGTWRIVLDDPLTGP